MKPAGKPYDALRQTRSSPRARALTPLWISQPLARWQARSLILAFVLPLASSCSGTLPGQARTENPYLVIPESLLIGPQNPIPLDQKKSLRSMPLTPKDVQKIGETMAH